MMVSQTIVGVYSILTSSVNSKWESWIIVLIYILSIISYFTPLLKNGDMVSAKSIYGFSDDEFGGFGLDTFSNYWLYFGRNLISYILGLSFISWMLGRIYVFSSIFLQKIRFKEGELVIFVLLLILFMEGRAFMFPILLLISWFLYKIKLSRIN